MSDTADPALRIPLSQRAIASVWAPLAASWLLMGLELPVVSAVMARLPDATISLAAYGGVVFPLALMFESPIIMLLSASTALARDAQGYRVVRRFMLVAAGSMLAVHALVAFTPIFDFVVGRILAVPPETRASARIGLRLMLPWVVSIAYRRVQQGILIRAGRTRAVAAGTAVRLASEALVLGAGLAWGRLPGIVVGCGAVACGVLGEAAFAAIAVRPALRVLRRTPPAGAPLAMREFLRFYLPLMVTPFINFIAMPLGAAAMSRMPRALDSLAAWPALSGAAFTMRSLGFAYNEVVVALLERWRPVPALRRFAILLAIASTAVLALAALTPLGLAWFARVSALPATLAPLAAGALAWLAPSPAFTAGQSYYQGALVHARHTRGVTESVVVTLAATALVLGAGVAWQGAPGVHFAAAGLTAGALAQFAWLALRGRAELAAVSARDSAAAEATA